MPADGPPDVDHDTGADQRRMPGSADDQQDGGSGRRGDLIALGVALTLISAAVIVGFILRAREVRIHAATAPLYGNFEQHVGLSSLVAVAIAALVIGYGPAAAGRLRWPVLLVAAWITSILWVFSLALVAGWPRLSGKLEHRTQYLAEVPDAPPVLELLETFADRIVAGPDESWTTHVAGHPPGALSFFIGLDRVGLGGGAAAAVVVILLGSSACVAVAVALRAIDSERMARRAVPFLVLAPAAIWIAGTGDGLFLAVSAWGVALLAVASRAPAPRMIAVAAAAGLLLGFTLYLSYGLVLMGMLALAILVVTRRLMPVVIGGIAVLSVVAAVTIAGFAWWEGLDELVVRYNYGPSGEGRAFGSERPYSYWVWANLAALAISAGPAVAPGVRRAIGHRTGVGTAALVLAAVLAVIAANLSGLSKGEVERIWLPFAIWLIAACAFLPRDLRWWLGLQAVTALVVIHLTLPGR